jgi:hypothetical protein
VKAANGYEGADGTRLTFTDTEQCGNIKASRRCLTMNKFFTRRLFLRVVLTVGAILPIGTFAVRGQRPATPAQPDQEMKPIIAPPARQAQHAKRIRDGTPFKDMHVFFRPAGDRTALYTVEDNRRFTCLENLQLERILTAIQEKSGREFWKVEGEFTEFRGENYVLIRRAVFAEAPAVQPAPSVLTKTRESIE